MRANHTVSKPKQSVYEIVTDRIVAELEAGVIPWHKPWMTEAPKNLSSGKAYRGINIFLLGMRGFASPWWMTFKQAMERGGHVRKGEKGTTVVFWKWKTFPNAAADDPTDAPEPDGETKTHNAPILRYYTVFNVEQCEGIAASASNRPVVNPIDAAEAIAAYMPNAPGRETSFRAAYRPSTNTVMMPPMQSFESAEAFYSTLFHELAHSTGHASRLARPNVMDVKAFGSEEYSREELVAEMTASMVSAIAGIKSRISSSAAYIQSWLNALKGDSRMVVIAAAQAQKAADYIQGVSSAAEVAAPELPKESPAPAWTERRAA